MADFRKKALDSARGKVFGDGEKNLEAEDNAREEEQEKEEVKELSEFKLQALREEMDAEGNSFGKFVERIGLNRLNFGSREIKENYNYDFSREQVFYSERIRALFTEDRVEEVLNLFETLGEGITNEDVRNVLPDMMAGGIVLSLQEQFDRKYREFFEAKELKNITYTTQFDGYEIILNDPVPVDQQEAFKEFTGGFSAEELAAREKEKTAEASVEEKYQALAARPIVSQIIVLFAQKPGESDEETLRRVAAGGSFIGGILAGLIGVKGFEGLYDKTKGFIEKYSPEAVAVVEKMESSARSMFGEEGEEIKEKVMALKEVSRQYFDKLYESGGQILSENVRLRDSVLQNDVLKLDFSAIGEGVQVQILNGEYQKFEVGVNNDHFQNVAEGQKFGIGDVIVVKGGLLVGQDLPSGTTISKIEV